jgi:hypothetical protein
VEIGGLNDHSTSPEVVSSEVEMVLLRDIVVADWKTNHYMCIGAFELRAFLSDASCLRDHVPLANCLQPNLLFSTSSLLPPPAILSVVCTMATGQNYRLLSVLATRLMSLILLTRLPLYSLLMAILRTHFLLQMHTVVLQAIETSSRPSESLMSYLCSMPLN